MMPEEKVFRARRYIKIINVVRIILIKLCRDIGIASNKPFKSTVLASAVLVIPIGSKVPHFFGAATITLHFVYLDLF
jgi:hypothetical protein